MSHRIELSLGMFSLVDDVDAHFAEHKWYLRSNGYACRSLPGGHAVALHRAIADAPMGYDVDHINGDRLDNRRLNLRIATRSENMKNKWTDRPRESIFQGVFRRHIKDGWWVLLACNGKQVYLGDYDDEEKAARASDAAARFFGLPGTNFPGTESMSPQEILIANGQTANGRGSSRFRGVRFVPRVGKWRAEIHYNGKNVHIGEFLDEMTAARIWDQKALELLGPAALPKLNFKTGLTSIAA